MRFLSITLFCILLTLLLGCVKPLNHFSEDDAREMIEKNWTKIAEQTFKIGIDLPPDPDFLIKEVGHKGKGYKSSARILVEGFDEKKELGKFVVSFDLDWDDMGNYKAGPIEVSKKPLLR